MKKQCRKLDKEKHPQQPIEDNGTKNPQVDMTLQRDKIRTTAEKRKRS